VVITTKRPLKVLLEGLLLGDLNQGVPLKGFPQIGRGVKRGWGWEWGWFPKITLFKRRGE